MLPYSNFGFSKMLKQVKNMLPNPDFNVNGYFECTVSMELIVPSVS